MSPLRWTTKSLRALAAELTWQGHRAGADTVADLLHEEGFSLQGNAKALEGKQSPDRDAQFRYLNEQVRVHLDAGEPVVSVDTKKKDWSAIFTMAAVSGGQRATPSGSMTTTSPIPGWARPSRTGSTTWPRTPAG